MDETTRERDFRRLMFGIAGASLIAVLVMLLVPPPKKAEAAEQTWIELPGEYPPSMIRFHDKETGAWCYFIPGKYQGLGMVYSPALACVRVP